MKLSLSTGTLLLLLVTSAAAVKAQNICTCKAPDNSCSGRLTCPHGGTALCGSKNACYVACGRIETDKSYARITIKIENAGAEEISSSLSRHSGRNIKFTPWDTGARYSFELKNDSVRKALKLLAKRGKVTVSGTDFEKLEDLRRKMSKDEKVSMSFTDVSVRNAVADLSFLSGKPFQVTCGDANKRFSIDLQEVTLSEIIDRISAQTGVKIEKR